MPTEPKLKPCGVLTVRLATDCPCGLATALEAAMKERR
jgi:hypothetical protein